MRKRNLALLTVHGPLRPEGLKAWGQIRESGLRSVRPIEILRALWGEGEAGAAGATGAAGVAGAAGAASVASLCMPCDGAVPGVAQGRFVEGPARVDARGAQGVTAELPIELEDVMEQLSLCNILYAEAAATGSRQALREALEVDPAYAGIDLLYAEGVLSDMMEGQKERLKRFF